MSTPTNIKYPKVIKEIIEDIKSINKKLNDDNDLAVAIEAKTIAINNKSDVENLKAQQQENINKFNNILGIANEGNERSKVNTQRLDLTQATDDINTFVLELYIINSWNAYFGARDSNHNPQPLKEAILIKETPIKNYNYFLN